MSFKFIHAADVHLDAPLRGLPDYEGAPTDEIRTATRNAFEGLIQFALDQEVAFVLIAGDLYDGALTTAASGLFVAKNFERLNRAGIDVVLIRGNHDSANKVGFEVELPPNCHVLSHKNAETVELLGGEVAVHGQSFATGPVPEDLAKAYPDPITGKLNIGVLHTSLDGAAGHDPYAPTSVATLKAKGYDYWALGHIHLPQVIAESPWIVYSGCLQGRHARETGPRGAMLVEADGTSILTAEHVELDFARWEVVAVDAAGCTSLSEVRARITAALETTGESASGKPLAARIVITGATSAHGELAADHRMLTAEVVAASAGVRCSDTILIEKVVLNTERPANEETVSINDDESLAQVLSDLRAMDADALAEIERSLSSLAGKVPTSVKDLLGGGAIDTPERILEAAGTIDEEFTQKILSRDGRPD